MLPSGYIPCVGVLPLNNSYIDTGILPKATLSVDALFSGMGYYSASGYLFGARNSNSNTSAGQLNCYANSLDSGVNYFGFANSRTNMGVGDYFGGDYRQLHFYSKSNEAQLISQSGFTLSATNTSSFTTSATMRMFIFGMNNAGSLNGWMQLWLHGFLVYDDGALVYDGEPSYEESTSKYGIYDHVSNTFSPLTSARSMYRVDMAQSTGGQAYARTFHKDYVKVIYGGGNGSQNQGYDLVQCVAREDNGYAFKNWTDSNGNIISTEKEFEYKPTANETITANFIPVVTLDPNGGCKAMFLKYGGYWDDPSIRNNTFANVLSGSVMIDSLQRATSTFVLDSIPSSVQVFCPVFITSPKGEPLYQGIVWSIEDNTITCREPLSILDEDFLFGQSDSYISQMTAMKSLVTYADTYMITGFHGNGFSTYDYLARRRWSNINIKWDGFLKLNNEDNLNVTTPLRTEKSVENMEDYLFSMFELGIFVKARYGLDRLQGSTVDHPVMFITPFYHDKDEVTMSDNVENITSLSVVEEETETTALILFNSNGTTLKGYYTLDNDGNYVQYDSLPSSSLSNLLAYTNYKSKIVMSDDSVKTVLKQNLNNARLGHKITFDLMLDGELYRFDSLSVGQPVKFYYRNKMYKSIVTGLKFDIDGHDVVGKVQVTLGNVRQTLTAKFLLNKRK